MNIILFIKIYYNITFMNDIIKLSNEEASVIFPKNNKIDMNKLVITEEGKYSVSKRKGAIKLVNIIYKIMKTKDVVVTDATANVGSDSLMLAKYFKKVNSIELNTINYAALKNNVEVYGYKNINIINGDSLKVLDSLNQDVLVADFPWGGPDYKKHKYTKLYIGTTELSDFYKKFKNNAKLHIYKVPYNYDINNFLINTGLIKIVIYSFKNKDKIKYLLLIIKNK
jgi:hypothetical protein